MEPQPILETNRLMLRPFVLADATRVELLAGDERIAEVTKNIPHPYPEGLAKTWISSHVPKWKSRQLAAFAITLKESSLLIGCISIINISEAEGELGYWIDPTYWNKGFCSEACKSVVEFGTEFLRLSRIHARHLSRNPASGKVLLNSGLVHIGTSESECGYRNQKESIELYERIAT